MIEFDLQGTDQVLARLREASAVVRKKAGRAALRKAANVVVKAAREKVKQHDDPATGRSIAKNVTLQWNNRVYRATGDLAFRIGVKGGARLQPGASTAAKGPTPHWRFLEFGTEKMRAFPFLRPALSENLQKVADTFTTELMVALDKALAT